jgi:hypothetical protein
MAIRLTGRVAGGLFRVTQAFFPCMLQVHGRHLALCASVSCMLWNSALITDA